MKKNIFLSFFGQKHSRCVVSVEYSAEGLFSKVLELYEVTFLCLAKEILVIHVITLLLNHGHKVIKINKNKNS